MNRSDAAKLWAALEQRLVGRCGLRDGAELLAERPHLVRMIGDALPEIPDMPESPERSESREEAWERLSELAGRARDGGILPMAGAVQINRLPVSWWKNRSPVADDPAIDQMLSKALDRSCSRRMGYDGDDQVSYGNR